jgi:hypothetical protein
MEREQKEIVTPGGHKVVVKTYLTAKEVNGALKQILSSTEVPEGKAKLSAIVGIERNEKLVEAAVISLDYSAEDLSTRLGELPITDWQYILKEAGVLAEGNF